MEVTTFTCQLCRETGESLDFFIIHHGERCYFQFPRDIDHICMVTVIKVKCVILFKVQNIFGAKVQIIS